MAEAVLELKNLTKRIGNKNVVDDLSLTVNRGEIFGLLGPNGAGKTTAIRMIVGLISKSQGDVAVAGVDAKQDFVKTMTEIGAIVENPEMYKFLSGYQNLLQFARMAKDDISKERIYEVVKMVELENVIHKKVKTYSLGMRQRLGVAQAMLHNPSLLILDEPTNGLDPQGIYDFRSYLRELTKEGISVLVSSHQLSEMQMMCDRVAIIQEGKLVDIRSIIELTDEGSGQSLVQFEVNDVSEAENALTQAYPDAEVVTNDEHIQLMTAREDIPDMNRTLVEAGVSVYGISVQKYTLEEKFLEMTKAGEA